MRRSHLAGCLTLSAAVGHVLYPLTVHLVARGKAPLPLPQVPESWPDVTVVIPAYLEVGVVSAKVADVLANDYPGELHVLVVADGDEATARAADGAGARVLLLPERRGKSQALNRGVQEATTDVVVLTDANNTIEKGAVEKLVRHLLDDSVGAVAGEKLEGSGGELAYWRFESWIKRAEARLGSTLGLDGGLCALRRSAWVPIPPDVSNDDLWIALDLMDRGHRVAYEPGAVVREDTIGGLSLSWERRTRVLAGGLYVIWRKRHLLDPRRGLVSAEIWGHKLWRSTAGPLSHLALLGLAVASARTSRSARAFVAAHAVAALAGWAQGRGSALPLPLRIGSQVLYLQAVALAGVLRWARGDRVLRWDKPAR